MERGLGHGRRLLYVHVNVNGLTLRPPSPGTRRSFDPLPLQLERRNCAGTSARTPQGNARGQARRGEFRRRFLSQFPDPAFEPLSSELDRIAGAAWDAYANGRKSPRTRKAGPGFADPTYDLAVDWIAAKEAIDRRGRSMTTPRSRPAS